MEKEKDKKKDDALMLIAKQLEALNKNLALIIQTEKEKNQKTKSKRREFMM